MPKAKPKTIAYVVPHTHWDRDWYQCFEHFRIQLLELTGDLLDILDRQPDFVFTLDGQTVVLEDILAIRPDWEPRLARHIRSGRLSVGPWFALPDEYLVSGEALVRNLLLGRKIAGKYHRIMQAGYTPDSFGHVSQLPQILNGFGIESVLFARGMGDEGQQLGLEFEWQASGGNGSVLACHLIAGYFNLSAWGGKWGVKLREAPFDADRAVQQAQSAIAYLQTHKRSSNILLLLNGIDHQPAQPSVPAMLRHVQAHLPDVQLRLGNFADFVRAVRQTKPRLLKYQGELHSGRYHHILSGVFSTRMPLKQRNSACQRLLESTVEPLSAYAAILGRRYPTELLTYAWKELIKNHPHDDICGCSIDEVHHDMLNRFAHVEQVGGKLAEQGLAYLVTHIQTEGRNTGIPVVVYNPTGWKRSERVTFEAQLPAETLPGRKFRIVDSRCRKMPATITASAPYPKDMWHAGCHHRETTRNVTVDFLALELPPNGWKTFYIGADSTFEEGTNQTSTFKPADARRGATIENSLVSVEVNRRGTITIRDKQTGAVFKGGNDFEDTEDAGDEYDYSPLPQGAGTRRLASRHGLIRSIRLEEDSPLGSLIHVRLDLPVPLALADNRKIRDRRLIRIPIETWVRITPGSRRVDFTTRINNRAEDHRMRVLFPTPIHATMAHAESKFDVLSRPVSPPQVAGWAQNPVPTQHVERFVSIDDGRIGFSLLNRGLPEYAACPTPEGVILCQTLFRSVGALSRDGLATRSTHAGPALPTPEAQCAGIHTFHYAVVPHAGSWEKARVYIEAWQHDTPVLHCLAQRQKGPISDTTAMIRVTPDSVITSAVKGPEEGEGLIVRLFQLGSRPVYATVRFHPKVLSAVQVRLNETPQRGLTVHQGHKLHLRMQPREIVTLRVKFVEPERT